MAAISALAACASSRSGPETGGLDRADRYVEQRRTTRADTPDDRDTSTDANPARVVAEIDGRAIRHEETRERLIELAGVPVLDELALERRLEARCAVAGVTIDEDDLQRERDAIERAIIGSGVVPESAQADRLIRRIRADRGLGEVRFEALIRRNAMLRALVGEAAAPKEEEIRRAYHARYGEKRVARLITLPTLAEANRVARLARTGEDFADLATRFSTDVSAARGGLLEPLSVEDERYPRAIRDELESLRVREVSGAILLDSGYAVLKLVRVDEPVPDAPTYEQARAAIASEVRSRRQRILMEELANRLTPEGGELDIFDPQLQEAWRRRSNARR